jgi:hypothetical protein
MVLTGVNKAKLITVYKPEDGGITHATVGFAGFYGALAGMSAEGITGTLLISKQYNCLTDSLFLYLSA